MHRIGDRLYNVQVMIYVDGRLVIPDTEKVENDYGWLEKNTLIFHSQLRNDTVIGFVPVGQTPTFFTELERIVVDNPMGLPVYGIAPDIPVDLKKLRRVYP